MIQQQRPIITLTTDFGTSSAYVAQMKAVILSRNSDVQLVDITHEIPAQDIRSAAIVLDDVARLFPPRTIHVVVVDPGVGTERPLIYAKIGPHRFLAPDNGLLTLVARRTPPELIVSIVNRLYFLSDVSATFHGRDILAPVAAHISLGLNPERLGERRDTLVMLPMSQPIVEAQRITGCVVQIDRFGNVITNISKSDFTSLESLPARVQIGDRTIQGIVRTYGDHAAGTLISLFGSAGRLELALVNGNAGELLHAKLDDPVIVEW